MSITNHFLYKRNLLLLFLISALIISGLIEPILKKSFTENWDKNLIEKIIRNENKIIDVINNLTDEIVFEKIELKHLLKTEFNKKNNLENFFILLTNPKFKSYHIQINDKDGELICWNNNQLLDEDKILNNINYAGQAYFIRKDLSTYYYIVDTLTLGEKSFFIAIGKEVEKHYKLDSKYDAFENLTTYLSKLVSTNVKIDYNRSAPLSFDGREHSFFILNNYNNKIGVATFEKPAIDIAVKELEENFRIIQSVLILLIYLVLGFIGFKRYKSFPNKNVQFILLVVYVAIFRIILFYTGIPSNHIHSELTDPSNFSSSFAFGIVRSPLDFFLTIVCLVLIVYNGYQRLINSFATISNNQKRVKFLFIFLISSFLVLMIYRGVGASIRSVVFDSTIRYFKEFSLIPSPEIFLMDLNILLLGYCAILCSVLLMKWILHKIPIQKISVSTIIILFVVVQTFGFIFDELQTDPQGTPLIRILFITLLFALTYLTIHKPHRTIFNIYYGFASAIIVVNLFVYYNSELERESLRTIAYDLTRKDESIYEFILYQTLLESNDKSILKNYGEGEINYSAIAFEVWNKSLLFRENIPSSIYIYNSGKKLLGSFSCYDNKNNPNLVQYLSEDISSPKIVRQKSIFDSNELLVGITTIDGVNKSKNYLIATALFTEYSLTEDLHPKFLTVTREGITSATEFESLKIFVFTGYELTDSYGGILLNTEEAKEILGNDVQTQNEKWKKIAIKGEPHLVFILKPREKNNNLIAVAIEERRFAWKLSNFFKVFFVHSLIISFLFVLYASHYFNKWKEYFQRYKTKLTFSFILVSVVPLLIISSYIRNINENNNKEMINGYLNEFIDQLNSYYKKYNPDSNLYLESLLEKAHSDLNIEFNCYEQNRLTYSTKKYFYEAGILSSSLNPQAYFNLVILGGNKLFVEENANGVDYYSVYLKVDNLERNTIFSINTLMNKASIPIKDIELDIFLFGILAVALILLIIFSTILADQISSPIRRLTHATRSIGSGDLNFEIEESGSDEISELSKSFNMMIRKLKKSQIELAQLERETAWKEMAKQVAHEIKNPLTPMKLSIQQLIIAYKDKSPKFDHIFDKVTNTVINQIETLKNIASEFSNFARMPNPTIEKIDLISLIKETLDLFSDEKCSINFSSNLEIVYVNADSDHLSRAIINLVRNSIQANASSVTISVKTHSNKCEINIEDNGSGIDPIVVEKVFEENFTTKPKGMGLGLSMTKKFIESIDGEIRITKTSPEGTIFTIILPIAQ